MCLLLNSILRALAEKPTFNSSALIGAVAGYLLVGYSGGVALNSLLVLDPGAFSLPAVSTNMPAAIAHAPALLGAAFASLTTIGSSVLEGGSLTSLSASVAITIVGQLYVAILIAGVLSKPRSLSTVRKAAHSRLHRSTGSRRVAAPRSK